MTDRWRNRAALVAGLAALLLAPSARAGGGPENVFLVVNAASWASLTVANHYIQLRGIPASNVFYIDWRGGFEGTDGETFRKQILLPALEALDRRGVFPQVDYILYSSDLPYTVNLSNDFVRAAELPAQASPSCSINSATYLWHLVLLKTPIVMDFSINHYMRSYVKPVRKIMRRPEAASLGFRSWYGWGNQGELQEAGGQPYMLSTMVAMTSGRGNSVREALHYLKRSAAADGTFPKGTIYFTQTDDIRSKSRLDEVPAAIAELAKLGVAAKVVPTPMPQNAPDVAGLIAGVNNFSWAATRSEILPGAICDNFTSFGGILTEGAGQTPLTEFLRYGAAGSAGTVIEPYAMPEKFASPNIFVHYAKGCTLAESYYQSLFAPAQVLIVGDALCRPWANIPQVHLEGVPAGGRVSGTLVMKPIVKFPRGGQVGRFELFVDGRRAGSAAGDEALTWDSTSDCDGYHELRVVAIDNTPIATQGRAILPVLVNNHGRTATMTTTPAKTVRWDQELAIDVKAPGMKQIFLLNNNRLLGTIAGEAGQVKVNPRLLGLGPVSLQAVGVMDADYRNRVIPPPLEVTVEPDPPLKGQPAQPNLGPGLVLRLPNNTLVPIQETRDPSWLSVGGVGPGQPFVFLGYFDVDADEVYQFQLWHHGTLNLAVDGKTLYAAKEGDYTQRWVPVNLAKGQHVLTVSGQTATNTNLRILFGGPGSESLSGRRFKHPRR